jgi:hypothetical protein
MKKLLTFMLLGIVVLTNFLNAIDLKSFEHHYASDYNIVTITSTEQPRNDKDWMGIYAVDDNTDWKNVIDWSWAKDESDSLYEFLDLDDGNYEARFFFNNTYKTEASVPFIVGDVVSIDIQKEIYQVNEEIVVKVAKISGNRDWVGIYPKGSNNSWSNVVKWEWAKNNGNVNIDGVEAGEYEARLFFQNSYKVESKIRFKVNDVIQATLSTSKNNYIEDEMVTVNVSNLSGNKDWVGIYPKNTNNSWRNVIAWNWVTGNGSFDLSSVRKDMPIGEYEVRLFFNNSYNLESKTEFTVNDDGYIYGSKGQYTIDWKEDNGDYFAAYPKENIKNAPLVLLSGYKNLNRYKGLMKFLASHGCYVVAHTERKNNEGWSDPAPRIKHFENAILDVEKLGIDTSRLITMGSSSGGMVSYKIMNYFKKQGYGSTKSFIIDIEGYYAVGMKKDDLNQLESDSLILHLGGYTGVQDAKFDEDPRTLLSLSKILNNNMEKSFIVLNSPNHSYASGTYEDIIQKKDLLIPIDAMLKYKFFNDNGQYDNAKAILFDNYKETVQKVYDTTMIKVGDKKPLAVGYDYPCVNPYDNSGKLYQNNDDGRPFELTIDYCNDHGLQ